jgi:hypothetical protein
MTCTREISLKATRELILNGMRWQSKGAVVFASGISSSPSCVIPDHPVQAVEAL